MTTSTLILFLVIILPFVGFIITNVINYFSPAYRRLIASVPTLVLFVNVIISFYLFHKIAFVEYNKVITSQLADKAAVYYNANNVSLDLGT